MKTHTWKFIYFGWLLLSIFTASVHAQESSVPILIGESGKGWIYNSGSEFAGTKGSLSHHVEGDDTVSVLSFDLTAGGRYVAALIGITVPAGYSELRMQVKSAKSRNVFVRLRDSSGQYHQITLPYNDEGRWQPLRIDLTKLRASQRWGGKNDGRLYFPLTQMWFCVGHPQDPIGVVEFREVKAIQ